MCDQRERGVESGLGLAPSSNCRAIGSSSERDGLRWRGSPGRTGAYCGSRSIRCGVGEASGQRNRLVPLRASSSIPDYVKVNPNAVVPTLIHDGRVIIESAVIKHHVDDMFGGPSLMLAEPLARFRTECEPADESRLE